MRPRLLARTVVALAAGLVLSLAGATAASAHAGFAGSDPAAGSVVTSAPAVISLSFTEPPDPSVSLVFLYEGEAGREVAVSAPEIGRDVKQLVVRPEEELPDGLYTVSWKVTSQTDTHTTAGAFAFRVGPATDVAPAPVVAAPEVPGPAPLGVLSKILLYAGLVLLVGAAATAGWIDRGGARERTASPTRRGLLAGAGVAAVLGAAGMLLAESRSVGVSLGALVASPTGKPFLRLLVAAGVAAVLAVVAAVLAGSRRAVIVAGLAAAAAMLVRAMSGHPAAGEPPWPQELLQFLHFCAIGIWIGGLVWTLLLLRRAFHEDKDEGPGGTVRRFSLSAGAALTVVLVTGVLRTIDEAGGIGAVRRLVLDTSYGTTLAVKIAVVLVILAVGAVNRYRSIPRLEAGQGGHLLRRLMTVEIVGAVGVFALTGVLTSLPPQPANGSQAPERPAAITATASDFATTFRATLTATPGNPGANEYRLTLTGYDDGEPFDADGVALRFTPVAREDVSPSQLDLAPSGDPGVWTGSGTELSLPGIWDVQARVEVGAETTDLSLPVSTIPATAPQPPVIFRQEGLPDVATFTLDAGRQLQISVDPGTAGPNDVHVTAFEPSGAELPLSAMAVLAVPAEGPGSLLEQRRLSTGHFVADGDLPAGDWRFDIMAVTAGGSTLQASLDQTIG